MIIKNRLQVYQIILGLCLLLASGAAACQTGAAAPPSAAPTEPQVSQPEQQPQGSSQVTPAVPTTTPEDAGPDPAAIQVDWQSSPHANAFVQDAEGRNNSCARCHAPINWMPTMDELPESCFACKFELEDPPQYIPENDWTNIPCNVCHEVDKKKNIQPEIAWLEIAPLGEYAQVASPTELCLKCHIPIDLPQHGIVELGGVHTGYECTKCHSAHNTTASCDTAGCHVESTARIAGHDEDHKNVSCVACHDASSMQVGLDEEKGLWITFVTRSTDAGTEKFSFTSHNTVLEANCDRCHFAQNPWGLSELTEQP